MLIIGILSIMGGLGTLAYYTTSADSTANTFTAGKIKLQLSDSDEGPADSVAASIVANVATNQWRPGRKVTAPITVDNTGDLALTYGLSYTASDSGSKPGGGAATPTQFLKLNIKAKGTGNGTASDCTTANFSDAGKWQESIISEQTMAVGTAVLWADTVRSINAASNEVLCFQVEFTNGAAGVENNAMGGTSTVAFNFTGRQEP
jgi:predicted ribosomally synthesized peptide with SipW-like signal peptide